VNSNTLSVEDLSTHSTEGGLACQVCRFGVKASMHAEAKRNPVRSSTSHALAHALSPVQNKLGIGGSHKLLAQPGSSATPFTKIKWEDALVDYLEIHALAIVLSPVQCELGLGGSHEVLAQPGSSATLITKIRWEDSLVNYPPVKAHGDSVASANSRSLEGSQADRPNREGIKRRAEHLAQTRSRLV